MVLLIFRNMFLYISHLYIYLSLSFSLSVSLFRYLSQRYIKINTMIQILTKNISIDKKYNAYNQIILLLNLDSFQAIHIVLISDVIYICTSYLQMRFSERFNLFIYQFIGNIHLYKFQLIIILKIYSSKIIEIFLINQLLTIQLI